MWWKGQNHCECSKPQFKYFQTCQSSYVFSCCIFVAKNLPFCFIGSFSWGSLYKGGGVGWGVEPTSWMDLSRGSSLEMSYLPTAYVVWREGNVFTRVCSSIHSSFCLSTPRIGGYYSQVQMGGGVPQPGPGGRYPCWGYPTSGTPHRTWPGGTPAEGPCPGGTPPRVHPLSDLAGGGVPLLGGDTPPQVTDGVLDTPRSVCLLRSRGRSFLFLNIIRIHR